MNKKEIIKKIKSIINEFGGFTTAEVEAESSPCVASLGSSTCQLAESFYIDKVETIIYVDEEESSNEYIPYEDLKKNVLEEILVLAKRWEKAQEIDAKE